MSHYNFRVKKCSPTKLWQLTCLLVAVLTQVQSLGAPPPLKFERAKNVQNLVRFTKTLEFQRKYFQSKLSYKQAVNGVIKNV